MATEQDESRLDELLMQWEDLHDQGRSVPVEVLCAGHPELVAELNRRIEALRAMGPLLTPGTTVGSDEGLTKLPGSWPSTLLPTPPPWPLPAPTTTAPTTRRSASCSATFRDLEFHAAGGLGEVFMALGEDINRKVALKFIKRPRAHDPESRRMFLQEAEITGRLEHPGVVPVYSLGKDDDGHPCYAMRFIRGETLEDELRRYHDGGGDRAGLRLLVRRLLTVCNTIAYAHSRGVLHRDIKPRNVMLGKYDETLVVDWGLARPFDRTDEARHSGEETLAPVSGSEGSGTPEVGPVGTPAYMSPEQAAGDSDRVGPASDVYGLGATLYAVLTGRAPFAGKSVGEVLEKVRKGDFIPPRQVNAAVPRALDAVCRKAMALAPSDRYANALELADDLDRWLADEPVSAYRDPWHVRLWRWGRRHRTAVGTLAALVATALVALAAIAVITDRQKREVRRQYVRAEANFRLAHEAIDTMLGQVGEVGLADIPQMEPVRQGLLKKALEFSLALAGNRDNALPPLEIARAYRRVGDIEEMLGDYPAAESAYLRSVESLKSLSGSSRDARRELARADVGLGVLRKKSNRFEDAMAALDEAVDLCKALVKDAPTGAEDRKALADALYQKGALLARMPAGPADDSNFGWARDEYGEALKLLSRRDDPASLASRARYSNNLAILQTATGHPDEAEATLRKAKDVLERLAREAPSVAGHRWRLARTCTNLAVLLWPTHPDQAEPLDRTALALLKDLADQFPGVADYAEELAQVENNLALRLVPRAPSEADALLHDALARQTELARRSPNVPRYRHGLALTYLHLGILLEATDPDGADRTAYAPALTLLDDLVRRFPDIPAYHDALGRALYSQSFARDRRHEAEATRRLLDQSVEHHLKALEANPRNPLYAEHVRDGLFTLSKRFLDVPDLAAASRAAERLAESLPDDPRAHDLAAQVLTRCAWLAPVSSQGVYKDRAEVVLRRAGDKGLLKDVDDRIRKIEALLRNKGPRSG